MVIYAEILELFEDKKDKNKSKKEDKLNREIEEVRKKLYKSMTGLSRVI